MDAPSPTRATQTIPPAIRRQVLARHDNCCAVPGCHLSAFVDVHHTKLRSEGGSHDPELLVPLCSNHHDMTHRGRLIIRGTFSEGFVFQRADGDCTRRAPRQSIQKASVFGQAFEALRALGFKSGEAQRMLDAIRSEAPSTVEDAIRAALRAAPVRASVLREARPMYEPAFRCAA